jgi:hypothetical protein
MANKSKNASSNSSLRLDKVTDTILKNAAEGLFFLNEKLDINHYYSQSLEKIIGIPNLENRNFINLLENRVPAQIIDNTKEYLELIFRQDLDETVINELNPLIETEFFYEDEWGIWTTSKYLSFNFKRILESGKIAFIAVTIQDVSEKILLNKKLEQTEDHTQKQMEWLVNILHVEPEMLKEFFVGVEHELVKIEEILKNAKDSKNHRELIENIYRSLFIIKGNASLLDLRFFTDKANQFIEKVLKLKSKFDLSGADFVPIVVSLGDMRDTLKEVKTIFRRISHFHNHFRVKRTHESELLVHSLKNLIRSLSKQLDKNIEFDYRDFDALSIPYPIRQMVRDILFLLVRNAIMYGIEDTKQRISMNKNPNALIKISSVISNGFLGLVLKHDGRIDRIERLIQKMVTRNPEDEPHESQFEGMQVTQLLYTPNLQLEDENEVITNYSMDMELLKRKLKEKGGRLKITFTSDEHCEFTVLIPLKRSIPTTKLFP